MGEPFLGHVQESWWCGAAAQGDGEEAVSDPATAGGGDFPEKVVGNQETQGVRKVGYSRDYAGIDLDVEGVRKCNECKARS